MALANYDSNNISVKLHSMAFILIFILSGPVSVALSRE